jgi:hypothetical protein
MWKEEIVANLKVLFRNLLGVTEENHNNLIENSVYPDLPNRSQQLYFLSQFSRSQ